MSTVKDLMKLGSSNIETTINNMADYIITDKPKEIIDIDGLFAGNLIAKDLPALAEFDLSAYPNALGNHHLGANVKLSTETLGLGKDNPGQYLVLTADLVVVNALVDFGGTYASTTGYYTPLNTNGWGGGFPNNHSASTHVPGVARPSEYVGKGGSSAASNGYTSGYYLTSPSSDVLNTAGGGGAFAKNEGNTIASAFVTGGSAIIIEANSIKGSGTLSVIGGAGTTYGGGGAYIAEAAGGGGTITIFTKSWSGTVSLDASGGSATSVNGEDGTIRLWKINNDGTLTLMANNENGTPGVTLTIGANSYVPVNGGDFTIAF